MINREFMVDLANKLQGFHTRVKELHFSAESYDLHKITDEFDGALCGFEDELLENMQALFDVVMPGELNPTLPEEKDFMSLLEGLRGLMVKIKKEAEDNMMFTGIVNIVDGFFADINKYVYLTKIAYKELGK